MPIAWMTGEESKRHGSPNPITRQQSKADSAQRAVDCVTRQWRLHSKIVWHPGRVVTQEQEQETSHTMKALNDRKTFVTHRYLRITDDL